MSEFSISRIDDDSWKVTLDGDWDVRQVQKLYDALAEGVALSGAVRVDLDALTGTDTAVLQLLMSIRTLCEQRGQTFQCAGLKESIVQVASQMGLSSDLQVISALSS